MTLPHDFEFVKFHPPEMPFRFQSEKVHLTHKTHVPMGLIKDMQARHGDVKMASRVHEVGDTEEDTPTPCEHTHVFVWRKKRLDGTNVKLFDITVEGQVIHPHVKSQRSLK